MSTIALAPPIRLNTAGAHTRPGLGRLVAVERRKIVDTRAARKGGVLSFEGAIAYAPEQPPV